jgi:hypothetical protein
MVCAVVSVWEEAATSVESDAALQAVSVNARRVMRRKVSFFMGSP